MEIMENKTEWLEQYKDGWLGKYLATGKFFWDLYKRPKNEISTPAPPIDLSKSRLLFVSTAGTYLRGVQEPFDAPNPLGDYSIRTFPWGIKFEQLVIAHDHYKHDAINEDNEVLLPFAHLDVMVEEGIIGEMGPRVISFSGYQPDATRVTDEIIPQIIAIAKEDRVNAALLVPA